MRKLLLLSNSKLHGEPRLEFAKDTIIASCKKHCVSDILFVPYALKDHDEYTKMMTEPLAAMGFTVRGIHTFPSPKQAVEKAQCVFVGGGNTFRLLKELYDNELVDVIHKRVMDGKLMYMGASAGTNVATASIHTTNDMPIVYPPSFEALNLVPFNINPHFVDPDPSSTHMGETRTQRILEYLEMGNNRPVLGLYEGCLLEIEGNKCILKGKRGAKLFAEGHNDAKETFTDNQDISFLLG
ncbi:alpha-aspartyl dipeptidase [Galendromus occidentalis]|uniref:dipeptidase E n=1 Tax=Galendromus occidentalis TaxID=34638 RepID=A0AAJ6QYE6_9ACAR|nr:alpha-aspartyl dipeptidase [Galendromus occidentalis]